MIFKVCIPTRKMQWLKVNGDDNCQSVIQSKNICVAPSGMCDSVTVTKVYDLLNSSLNLVFFSPMLYWSKVFFIVEYMSAYTQYLLEWWTGNSEFAGSKAACCYVRVSAIGEEGWRKALANQ